jgi:hypothetical protein
MRFNVLGITGVKFGPISFLNFSFEIFFQGASFRVNLVQSKTWVETKENVFVKKLVLKQNMLAGNYATNSHLSKIYLLIAKFWRWQTLQLVGRIFWVQKMKSECRGIERKLSKMYLLIAKSNLV